MSGARAYSRTKGLASSSGLGNLITLGGLALTSSFTPITDSAGNYSALELNKATTDGFIAVNAPNPANTAGVYYKVAGNVIGDFRADLTNGFAMVAQSTYPISFYTNNTATKNASFNSDGSSSFYGTNGIVHVKTGNIIEFTRNSANYFHASASGGDFRWTVNGAAVASSSMLLTTSGNLVVGHNSASARMHVRGDGTNPIFRAEDNSGIANFQVFNNYMLLGGSTPFGPYMYAMSGTTFSGSNSGLSTGFYNRNTITTTASTYDFAFSGDSITATSGTRSHLALVRTFASGAGSANFRPLEIAYTINNSGVQTGTATGIYLNATETALNGMTHNLMDLQVQGLGSRFSVSNGGWVRASSFMSISNQNVNFTSYGNGQLTLFDNAFSNFNRINFGGTTNAFPAIKRSGTDLEVRLADDTGFTTLRAGTVIATGNLGVSNNMALGGSALFGQNDLGTINASAVLEARSITKGFLPPRMTTTQKNAITSPAAGLMVYDTTLNKLCVFTTVWETITSA